MPFGAITDIGKMGSGISSTILTRYTRNNSVGISAEWKSCTLIPGRIACCYHLGFSVIDVNEKYLKFASYYNNLHERTFAIYTAGDERVWVGNAAASSSSRQHLWSPASSPRNNRVEDMGELPIPASSSAPRLGRHTLEGRRHPANYHR